MRTKFSAHVFLHCVASNWSDCIWFNTILRPSETPPSLCKHEISTNLNDPFIRIAHVGPEAARILRTHIYACKQFLGNNLMYGFSFYWQIKVDCGFISIPKLGSVECVGFCKRLNTRGLLKTFSHTVVVVVVFCCAFRAHPKAIHDPASKSKPLGSNVYRLKQPNRLSNIWLKWKVSHLPLLLPVSSSHEHAW